MRKQYVATKLFNLKINIFIWVWHNHLGGTLNQLMQRQPRDKRLSWGEGGKGAQPPCTKDCEQISHFKIWLNILVGKMQSNGWVQFLDFFAIILINRVQRNSCESLFVCLYRTFELSFNLEVIQFFFKSRRTGGTISKKFSPRRD